MIHVQDKNYHHRKKITNQREYVSAHRICQIMCASAFATSAFLIRLKDSNEVNIIQ